MKISDKALATINYVVSLRREVTQGMQVRSTISPDLGVGTVTIVTNTTVKGATKTSTQVVTIHWANGSSTEFDAKKMGLLRENALHNLSLIADDRYEQYLANVALAEEGQKLIHELCTQLKPNLEALTAVSHRMSEIGFAFHELDCVKDLSQYVEEIWSLS